MGLCSKLKNWVHLWKNQFKIKNIANRRCEDNDSVLVIKLDAIGDFVIWLDSAKEYKKIFPDKHCVLMCNQACKPLAEVTGLFEKIITLDIKRFERDEEYQKSKIAELSDMNFGTLVQTAYSRTQHMDILAASIPANTKIGFAADESKSNLSRSLISRDNRKRLDGIYDSLMPATSDVLMELQRNKEFLHGLGHVEFKSAMPFLPITEGVNVPCEEYFIVFPGASTKIKTWRSNNFAKVIDYVISNTNWNCLVCGSKSEESLFIDIYENSDRRDKVENYCGKISIVELVEYVRNAKLVISNDTSGIHFANAVGTKAICPFGEYNYGRFLPYKSDIGTSTVKIYSANMKCRGCADGHMSLGCLIHILTTGRYLCIDKVSVDSVIEGIKQQIVGEILNGTHKE